MLRPLATTLAFVVTALVGPLGGTSYAGTCTALAVPPHLYNRGYIAVTAYGEFRCAEPADGMTVTVCIEEAVDHTLEVWAARLCETAVAEGPADSIGHETQMTDVPIYATWFRTTTTGGNAVGDTATVTSPPLFWFNCACTIW